MKFADRMNEIASFRAVDLSNLAQEKRSRGHDVISMGIGEPDFTAPPPVVAALEKAAREGKSGYTEASGIPELREAIARYYNANFGSHITASQVAVTSGASAGLAMTCQCFINPGDEILMPDPSYPPNMSFVRCAGGIPKQIPTSIEGRFQLTAKDIEANWGPNTRGVLLASPGNPTGTSIEYEELKRIVEVVKKLGGQLIMDEIYLGLYYGDKPKSVLSLTDDVVVINSFSKYFNMTGWRLGWVVLPEKDIKEFEKLSSNFAICASSLAQRGALACFEPDTIAIYEERRLKFKERLDFLIPALESLNIHVPVVPDGAFYIYADVSAHTDDSFKFAYEMLEKADIVVVPGPDFGATYGKKMIRISYATALDRLQEAMARLGKVL